MRKANILVSICLILISIFFIMETGNIKNISVESIGPKTFPYIVLWGIILLSGIILINSLRDKKLSEEKFLEKKELINVVITFLLIILYIVFLDRINFIIATFLFLTGLSIFYYGKLDKGIISIVIFAIVATLVIYYLFNNFFKILLP